MLPTPSSERWKPLRAGLIDMFYYDQEEFWFHDGRLLLRGNNGTGKSKVLALTLPFLLDGDLAPHRVEPDGDRQKRMERSATRCVPSPRLRRRRPPSWPTTAGTRSWRPSARPPGRG